jgi:hypothetical protein
MATITARYASICPTCGQAINPGDKVEWQRGAKATHTACPSAVAKSAPKTPRARRAPRAVPVGPELRNDRNSYAVGAVLVAQLGSEEVTGCELRQGLIATEIPGDPCKRAGDRRVAVVVIHADRISQEWADDNGYCGRYGAIVRLATAEEAAEVLAERAAKLVGQRWNGFVGAWGAIAEAVLRAHLASLVYVDCVDCDSAVFKGATVVYVERRGLHGSMSARWYRLVDGTIAHETMGGDDYRIGRWVTVAQLIDLSRESPRTLEDAIRGQRYSAIDRAIVWLAAQAGLLPRAPVTVTLHGLQEPVTLSVRVCASKVIAEVLGGRSVQVPDGDHLRTAYEWAWSIDQVHRQLSGLAAGAFSDLELAPGADLGDGNRLPLPGGLWIEGMRAALSALGAEGM